MSTSPQQPRQRQVFDIAITDSSHDIRFEGYLLGQVTVTVDRTSEASEGKLTVSLYETVAGNLVVHEVFQQDPLPNWPPIKPISCYRLHQPLQGLSKEEMIHRALRRTNKEAAKQLATILGLIEPKYIKEIP